MIRLGILKEEYSNNKQRIDICALLNFKFHGGYVQDLIVACLKKQQPSKQVIMNSACSQWDVWICFFFTWFSFAKMPSLQPEKVTHYNTFFYTL